MDVFRRGWPPAASPARPHPPSPTRRSNLGPIRAGTLCLALLLGACNRPAGEPPPNLLATSVAATLTAQPLRQATSPPAAASATPSAAPLRTPTASPSDPATAAPTASPVPLAADDPRTGIDLSSPDLVDDFVQAFWYVGSDDSTASFGYADGRLRVTDNRADNFLWWSTTTRQAGDLYVEITTEVGACAGKDAYGLAIRVGGQNLDRGYTLEIACDGSYRIRRFISEQPPVTLLPWSDSSAVVPGPQASNRIGLLARGERIHAFANGQLLTAQPVADDEYESGTLSLFASAAQTPGLTVLFDDLALWFLTP